MVSLDVISLVIALNTLGNAVIDNMRPQRGLRRSFGCQSNWWEEFGQIDLKFQIKFVSLVFVDWVGWETDCVRSLIYQNWYYIAWYMYIHTMIIIYIWMSIFFSVLGTYLVLVSRHSTVHPVTFNPDPIKEMGEKVPSCDWTPYVRILPLYFCYYDNV